MKYKVVFDIATAGYRAGGHVAFGCVFIVIGIGLVVFRHRIMAKWSSAAASVFSFGYLGFSLLWTTMAFASTYSEYRTALSARLKGTASVTEGVVSNFVPMPYGGHADEKFTVSGVTFSYSDYAITSGFNNTRSHGGPIDEGKRVRVTYVGNVIVRLEVADDK
jgi:hypothetical protein